MSRNIGLRLRHACPHGHKDCGTKDSLCGNCGDDYIRDLESTPQKAKAKAFAFGGSFDQDIGLVQNFQEEKKSSGCGGGRACEAQALDVDRLPCSDCGKQIGSNPLKCGICASILELPSNPAQPNIKYDDDFGPEYGSFGPCTVKRTIMTLENFRNSFEASKIHGFPFTGIDDFKRSASLLRHLLSQGIKLGIEGFNNSCFYIVLFWILSQGNIHERINRNCLSGYILYKLLWDLRFRLFVGRDIVEAFRLSLQEYPLFQRRQKEFNEGMNDPSDLLMLLEDNEIGILSKGPIFSENGCSFHICETTGERRCSSIQEALFVSVLHPSPIPVNCSIISFQFSQQKSDRFTGQTLGTEFEFPHDGVFLAGKLLMPRMFIIFKSQHYLVVFFIGKSFFLANSTSASKCGHFLPETCKISKKDAMELFRTQSHTIVFECVGNIPPPPNPYVEVAWFPPPPLPSVEVVRFFPPPPAPCAQVAPVPQRLAAPVQQVAPVPQRPAAPVSRARSTSKITVDDIQNGSDRWSCQGTSYSGRIERGIHQQQVYVLGNERYLSPQKLVDFLNFCESVNQ